MCCYTLLRDSKAVHSKDVNITLYLSCCPKIICEHGNALLINAHLYVGLNILIAWASFRFYTPFFIFSEKVVILLAFAELTLTLQRNSL